jgi:hypothetical protein
MEPWVPLVFLMVVLKIPVAALLYLIWWAIRAAPETEEATDKGGHGFGRRGAPRGGPRGPRRGPHAVDGVALPARPPGERVRRIRRPARRHVPSHGSPANKPE